MGPAQVYTLALPSGAFGVVYAVLARAQEEALAGIPDGAGVESDVQPSAHLTARCRVF
ncbi:hypothetical protein ACWC4D_23315 [Streptomyces sp. NPDC001288]|uniref:hypothetical protein n=1 Tax=unclassified Streptomyces TaxID=2593676 RepID=UPI0033277F48